MSDSSSSPMPLLDYHGEMRHGDDVRPAKNGKNAKDRAKAAGSATAKAAGKGIVKGGKAVGKGIVKGGKLLGSGAVFGVKSISKGIGQGTNRLVQHTKTMNEVLDAKTAFVIDALKRVANIEHETKNLHTKYDKIKHYGYKFYCWLFGADTHRSFHKLPRFVLLPFCPFDRYWANILVTLVLYNLFSAPLEWTFGHPPKAPEIHFFEVCIEIMFLLDLFVQSRRAVHRDKENGDTEYIWSRQVVRDIYLKSKYFWCDMLASIPLDTISLIAYATSDLKKESDVQLLNNALDTLSLLKFLRIARLYRWNRDFPQLTVDKSSVFRMAVFLLSVCHVLACGWYLLVEYDSNINGKSTWMEEKGGVLVTDPWFMKYLACLYTIYTMVLGENAEPVLLFEYFFAFVVLLIGALLMSWLMGQITVMVQNQDIGEKQFSHKIALTMAMMKTMKLPAPLQKKILAFYQYTWEKYRGKNIYSSFVASSSDNDIPLPHSLYQQVAEHLHGDVIRDCVLFQGCKHHHVLAIAEKLRLEVAAPNDIVVQQGDIADELFIISHGTANVFSESGILEWRLHAGSVVGEIAMVLNLRRTKTVRAMSFCDLHCLHKADFKEVMELFPDARERIVALANEHLRMNMEKDRVNGLNTDETGKMVDAIENETGLWHNAENVNDQSEPEVQEVDRFGGISYAEVEDMVRKEVQVEMRALLERLKSPPSYRLP
eukprot:g4256.t1